MLLIHEKTGLKITINDKPYGLDRVLLDHIISLGFEKQVKPIKPIKPTFEYAASTILAKKVEEWCIERIKSVTGDDLTGYTEQQINEYFGEYAPILQWRYQEPLLMMYKEHVFIYHGDSK